MTMRSQIPVICTPGKRTLKNFLATAMQPVGTVLYVYGGGWNFENTGASKEACSIGVPDSWIRFFQKQGTNYTYKEYNPAHNQNAYGYAGADCTGYAGWAIYNTLETVSGKDGYVIFSTDMAYTLAKERKLGTWTQKISSCRDFKPGDLFSMNGHVWICLGLCADQSMVILHSSPTDSRTGYPGGGVQLSALSDDPTCQAMELAQHYMSHYCPMWKERYEAAWKSYRKYTTFTGKRAGRFSWYLDERGLLDQEHYRDKDAEVILQDLFKEGGSSF